MISYAGFYRWHTLYKYVYARASHRIRRPCRYNKTTSCVPYRKRSSMATVPSLYAHEWIDLRNHHHISILEYDIVFGIGVLHGHVQVDADGFIDDLFFFTVALSGIILPVESSLISSGLVSTIFSRKNSDLFLYRTAPEDWHYPDTTSPLEV